jgi:cytokinesis protein
MSSLQPSQQQHLHYSNHNSNQHPDAFYLPRPADDRIIEELFLALMQKRGSQNIPEQARRQMFAYPPDKKWTLVYQDRLSEWQSERKRRTKARQTIVGADGVPTLAGAAHEEGSPEWYVRKVMEDSLSAKDLSSLGVSLRTAPIRHVFSPLPLATPPPSTAQ